MKDEKTAQLLKALTFLQQNLGLIASTHRSSQLSVTPFSADARSSYRHTCQENTSTREIKINTFYKNKCHTQGHKAMGKKIPTPSCM